MKTEIKVMKAVSEKEHKEHLEFIATLRRQPLSLIYGVGSFPVAVDILDDQISESGWKQTQIALSIFINKNLEKISKIHFLDWHK